MANGNGNSPFDSWPLKWQVVAKLGFPVAVAMYLVYMMTIPIPNALKAQTDALQRYASAAEMQATQNWLLISAVQGTCIAVSKTPEAAKQCVIPLPRIAAPLEHGALRLPMPLPVSLPQ